MNMSEPRVEQREAQHYAGIRTTVPMSEFSRAIPELTDKVFDWLAEHGVQPAGPSIVRYHVINMPGMMDVEMGVLVAQPVEGDERVSAGVLPAGRYAALVYTGVQNGIPANGALLDWGAGQGLQWDQWEADNGDAFGARYESLLTDPADEPDMARWETEVAIKLADE